MEDRIRQLESWCGEELGRAGLRLNRSHRRQARASFYRATSLRRFPHRHGRATGDGEQRRSSARCRRCFGQTWRARARSIRVRPARVFSRLGFRRLPVRLRLCRRSEKKKCLDLALESLLRIQSVESDIVPRYEISRFRDELAIFVEWLVRSVSAAPDAFASIDGKPGKHSSTPRRRSRWSPCTVTITAATCCFAR